jgi:hypothetical protein
MPAMIEVMSNIADAGLIEPRARPAGGGVLDFDDFLDIINPLQHLPLIGTAYREVTGDHIEAPARFVGGTLYGGVFGLLGALASAAYEGITGESVDGSLLGLFESEPEADPYRAQRAYASAKALID